MKSLILNSGIGSRMGELTQSVPKCLVPLGTLPNILHRQLFFLQEHGIRNVVITTGFEADKIRKYANENFPNLNFNFVYNPLYHSTNYIYSIYLAREFLQDDILLLHGDLFFDGEILGKLLQAKESSVVVNHEDILPQKDFKAVIENNLVKKIGIEFFENAVACQPFYKLLKNDWLLWLKAIEGFCEKGETKVYAENALNSILDTMRLLPLDIHPFLCREVDTEQDLGELEKICSVQQK